MFALFALLRQNCLAAWHFFSAVCKIFSCLVGLLPANYCLKCLFEILASKIVFETVNGLLEDATIHVTFSPHLIMQLVPDASEIAKTVNQDPTAIIMTFIQVFSSWKCLQCLCSLTYMHRLLEYAQILYFVLLIFISITPQVYCLWKQIDKVGFAKLFTKFQFDNNVQLQYANELSSAFPSTLALQASLKPNSYVAITTFVLWFAGLMLKTRDLPQCVKTLGRISSELFKFIFMDMCSVAIVLGMHGKLDMVTSIIFMLMYFVIAFLPNYMDCLENTVDAAFCVIVPRYFCPNSHTIFSKPPVLNTNTLRALGYALQDQESEIMLICYGFLPGDCPEQHHLHNTIFAFAIDFCVLLSFLTHVVFAKPKEADKCAHFEKKLETLTKQQDAKAKQQLLQQILADFSQHDVSNISDTLQKCYFCLRIVNRLKTRGYVSF
jgi:hypothetical protein